MALKVSDNEPQRAKAYLDSNYHELRKEGQKARQKLEEEAAGGIYEDRVNGLRVSLQTGEVSINGNAMIPVPARVSSSAQFKAPMGTRVRWCSVIASDEEGEWLQLTDSSDGALIDVFAYRAKPAPLKDALRAQLERDFLREERESLALRSETAADGAAQIAHDPKTRQSASLRSLLLTAVGALPFIQSEQRTRMCDSCLDILQHLDVSSKPGGGLVFLTDKDNCDALAQELTSDLTSPSERRLFVALLLQAAVNALDKQQAPAAAAAARRIDSAIARAAAPASKARSAGPWILGGLDERPAAGLDGAKPLLSQEKGGLRLCGLFYSPFEGYKEEGFEDRRASVLHEPWALLFFQKLKATLAEPKLHDLKGNLLVFHCPEARMPLLMYLPAIGNNEEGNPGMLWEVGPPHPAAHRTFIVRALQPYGQGAFSRWLVYTLDANMCSYGHADRFFAGISAGETQAWTPGLRAQHGFLFGGLYSADGALCDSWPGVGSNSFLRGVVLRRDRVLLQRTADQLALSAAGLGHLIPNEWKEQHSVAPDLVDGLMPGVLVRHFEFWRSGERTLWAYRMTSGLHARDTAEREAHKVSKSVYRTEWYDGYALHVELDAGGGAAIVRRVKRTDPLRKDVRRTDGPARLTLMNVLGCAPRSTAQRILSVLTRLVPQTEILFWTDGSVERDGEECRIYSIEIPRHELSFKPVEMWLPGESNPRVRILCNELSGMWLVEDCTIPALQKHIARLRHGVWLVNAEYEYYLLLPLFEVVPTTQSMCKLSTDYTVQYFAHIGYHAHVNAGTRPFTSAAKSGNDPGGLPSYIVYPLHVSGSHLRLTSVVAALYLAYLRLMTREYALVPPLLLQAFKDTPYDQALESGLVSAIMQGGRGSSFKHPDVLACQLPLMLMCLENGSSVLDRATVKASYAAYVMDEQNISPECLIPPATEVRLCEWTGEVGRKRQIEGRLELLRNSEADSLQVIIPPTKHRAQSFTVRDSMQEARQQGGAIWDKWLSWTSEQLDLAR